MTKFAESDEHWLLLWAYLPSTVLISYLTGVVLYGACCGYISFDSVGGKNRSSGGSGAAETLWRSMGGVWQPDISPNVYGSVHGEQEWFHSPLWGGVLPMALCFSFYVSMWAPTFHLPIPFLFVFYFALAPFNFSLVMQKDRLCSKISFCQVNFVYLLAFCVIVICIIGSFLF